MKKLLVPALILALGACGLPPPPAPPPPPPVRLPAQIEASIARLKEEETVLTKRKAAFERQIAGLQADAVVAAARAGKARYMMKLQLKQSHFSLDLEDHLKDSMNKAEFWIAVDREMYESSAVGSEILDKFRVGSFLMTGSIGSWHVRVLEKKLVEK